MVRSMTGFGRATSKENSERSFSIEIKSVNHRYLDINIRMPRSIISLEDKIRRVVSESLKRGKVDIFINIKNYNKGQGIAKVNLNFAESYVECLEELQNRFKNLHDDLSLSLLARHPEIISIEEQEEDLEKIWEDINQLLIQAIEEIISMRNLEGEKLSQDIMLKCTEIEEIVCNIENKSYTIVDSYKTKLETRLKELLENIDLDENRIAMELAMFADKASIDEEIIRLKSHLSQLKDIFKTKEPVGRRLDFLIQEMNRETNTIASKSTDLEITNYAINIKNIIEKIREQAQNIE